MAAIRDATGRPGLTPGHNRYQQQQAGSSVLMPSMEYEEALQARCRPEQENIATAII
jgi:hypothetical protein